MQDAYYRRNVCYCCEQPFDKPHFFYSEMCETCGNLNYQKRQQRVDLSGHHALVTGGRIKIGFETARLLLEMGADVCVTSRFPNDTLKRFQKLENFEKFQQRLHIIGADFRFIQSVQNVIDYFKDKPLDILINNAAQTVRKPAPFYRHLLEGEKQVLQLGNIVSSSKINALSNTAFNLPVQRKSLNSAEMSQLPLLPEDVILDEQVFPVGKFDKDGQQLDLRNNNSWMYELEDVSLTEMYEVLQINLITPFLFNTKLLPILAQNDMAFIINVSAMEGNFYAPRKHSRHPHTNMAKAALNMMTRSAASHYKDFGVFMNSVDTGWITNEKPNPLNLDETLRKTKMAIDEVDGAMRVLDPIITACRGQYPQFGKLFKNYMEYNW